MHEHFSFSHTLTGSLSDDPKFVLPDIRYFLILFRCLLRPYASRGAGVSLSIDSVFLSFLPSCYFLILDISGSVVIPVLYLYDIMRGCLYDIALIKIQYSFDLYLVSDYLRFSAYTWGIFLAYMRHRLVSRLCFNVFWEAGRDTNSSYTSISGVRYSYIW